MVLVELADYLQTQAVATKGTDLFVSTMPDTPDALLSLFLGSGERPIRVMGGTGIELERVRVEVLSRSLPDRPDQSITLAQSAFDELVKVRNQDLSGVRFVDVQAMQAPFFVQRDEKRRVIHVFNLRILKMPS